MKKLTLIFTVLSFSVMAQAMSKSVGSSGCGLGSMVFGSKPGLIQVVAATLNSTGMQTIGITVGTSNCAQPGGLAKLDAFVEANQVALANDVARGNGDTLAGISQILGCKNTQSVSETLKQNYQTIFPTNNVNSMEVSHSIRKVLHSNSVTCDHLG